MIQLYESRISQQEFSRLVSFQVETLIKCFVVLLKTDGEQSQLALQNSIECHRAHHLFEQSNRNLKRKMVVS